MTYKYNAKELDRMHGLMLYDYGARMYDPQLCRFTTVDPLADQYQAHSPYAYCVNNPVAFVDPDGMKVDTTDLATPNETSPVGSLISDSELFDKLYKHLDDSNTLFKVQYGEPTDQYGNEVNGLFNSATNTITLRKGKSDTSVLSEEFFHAFQSINKKHYQGKHNFEFEAKSFTLLLKREIGDPCISYKGMELYSDYVFVDGFLDRSSVFDNNGIIRDHFYDLYILYANRYAEYNRLNNIGNSHYKQQTECLPYSLLNLINVAK